MRSEGYLNTLGLRNSNLRYDGAMLMLQVALLLLLIVFALYLVFAIPPWIFGRKSPAKGTVQEKIDKSTELMKNGIRYHLEGLPRNASACWKSVEETLREAVVLLRAGKFSKD